MNKEPYQTNAELTLSDFRTPHAEISIALPASKSISNRVLLLNALSQSPHEVSNLSDCEDTTVMRRALLSHEHTIDIHAAGTAMRFLTAYFSHLEGERTIVGTARMCQRPIKLLVDALRHLGAHISYEKADGFPPLRIAGTTLRGGTVHLAGGVSSQYISALLMLAPLMEQGLQLHIEGTPLSRPYIQLTLALMEQYGVHTSWEGDTISIRPQTYLPTPFTVESDWSAASYWYELMALSPHGGDFLLKGLQANSLQGDAAVAKMFEPLGVATQYTPEGVRLRQQHKSCQHLHLDFADQPDLAQTLVCTCIGLDIPFRFTGLQSLRIKETDRIAALQNEAAKMGYLLQHTGDTTLEWSGERIPAAANPLIETYEDHRMAMSFAPLTLVHEGSIRIANPGVVRKSYPTFWEQFSMLKA